MVRSSWVGEGRRPLPPETDDRTQGKWARSRPNAFNSSGVSVSHEKPNGTGNFFATKWVHVKHYVDPTSCELPSFSRIHRNPKIP